MHSFRLWLHAVMKLHPGIQGKGICFTIKDNLLSLSTSLVAVPFLELFVSLSKCDILVSFGMFLSREWF